MKPEDLIFQDLIHQSEFMSSFNPDSVNTIRTMSMLRKDGTVKIYSSILRMGIKGAKVDNASSGGIVCGIRPNGQLKEVAYDTCANLFLKHPQGTAFESVTIPNFNECIEIVNLLAKRFCSISRLISWDLAIGEDGRPILIILYQKLAAHA